MKFQIKKAMAETKIKQIRKQLEDLEALDAQAKLQPMEAANDTFLIATHEDQRKKLLKELEKYEKVARESDGK